MAQGTEQGAAARVVSLRSAVAIPLSDKFSDPDAASAVRVNTNLATNGGNMTKLESYMVGGAFSATQFLAEVDGHPDDPPLKRALEELRFFTTDVKILGVYPADPGRRG